MNQCPFKNSQMVSKAVCDNCILNKLSMCRILKQKEVDLIREHGNIVSYKKGETIYKQGTRVNGLIILIKSNVKMVKTAVDGSDEILSIHKPIDLLGVSELIADCYYQTSAITIDDAIVNIIPKENFVRLMDNNPGFLYKISQYLSLQLLESQHRIVKLTKKHMRGRLADALIELHSMYNHCQDNDIIGVNLKRADLASYSNMTTANAIRTLSDFSKSGLIEMQGRQIMIKDLLSLKKISHFG